jgi:hypothetical protein
LALLVFLEVVDVPFVVGAALSEVVGRLRL